LRQESEMLTGRKVAWDEWKTSTEEIPSDSIPGNPFHST
jgi:hypothetical protein